MNSVLTPPNISEVWSDLGFACNGGENNRITHFSLIGIFGNKCIFFQFYIDVGMVI